MVAGPAEIEFNRVAEMNVPPSVVTPVQRRVAGGIRTAMKRSCAVIAEGVISVGDQFNPPAVALLTLLVMTCRSSRTERNVADSVFASAANWLSNRRPSRRLGSAGQPLDWFQRRQWFDTKHHCCR